MDLLKRILKLFLYPHPAIIVLLTPVSIALLIYSFVFLEETEIFSFLSYFLSAYTLAVLCLKIPQIIKFIKTVRSENKYVERYLSDTHLRINISLYSSLILNTAYAVFQLGLGFYHHTVWYYSFAVYYILLAVMRFFLLKYTRIHKAGENRFLELLIYRFCGMLLLVMNIALSVIITYVVLQGKEFIHHEITTIAMAAYTFATLIIAIVNVVKYRKYESPVFSSTKVISLATALVSMITLENTMLTTFGKEGQETFRLIMLALTGFAITIFILVMAISMIIKSTKKIKEIKYG